MGEYNLLHNVYFLAGATFIKKEKTDSQKAKFLSVVSGRVVNIYTKNDTTLTSFRILYKE